MPDGEFFDTSSLGYRKTTVKCTLDAETPDLYPEKKMDILLQLFNQFQVYSKANPIIAGAVSLWGLGLVTFMFRSVPMRIWGFLRRQCTTTLQFNNDGRGTGLETFGSFMKWFESGKRSRWSRSFSLNGIYYSRHGNPDEGTVLGVGDGKHFFFYKGRPVWINRRRIDQAGSFNLMYEVTITTLGRNRKVLDDMIEEFKYRPEPNKIGVFQLVEKNWVRINDIEKRPLRTVVLDQKTKNEITGWIDQWLKDREWYETRGLPYKMTFVFHGIPGTGKTSLIRALASHYQLNLCVLNITQMTDSTLEQALAATPPNTIIVIEDFDSSAATKARKNVPSAPVPVPATPSGGFTFHGASTPVSNDTPTLAKKEKSEGQGDSLLDMLGGMGGLSLTGLLQALDGVVSLNGKLVFMTTNVFDQMDAALVRKGRIDHAVEIKPATHAEVVEYIQLMFPDADHSNLPPFADIVGCDLQALYFEHRYNFEDFVAALPKKPFEPVLLEAHG